MKKKDQILLEEAYKQIREGSSWWGPTASDFKSTIAQTKKDSDPNARNKITQFAVEPKLSELAKLYNAGRLLKKDQQLTPKQVERDLKTLAFGNPDAQYIFDPDQFQMVYKALQNKLQKLPRK